MKISKYLRPGFWIRKIRLVVARILLSCAIPLRNSINVDGFLIKFWTTSFLEYFLRAEESYVREEVTMYWIRNFIKPDDVVYDVGANVGAYSLLIGKILQGGDGTVYAIEPESNNFSALNKNIILNQLTDKVVAYACAFGDSRRVSKLYLSSSIAGSSHHSVDKPESDGQQFTPPHIQGVLVENMDNFVAYDGIRFPNHIKIDVDGEEKSIVSNMESILADNRLITIMIEVEMKEGQSEIDKILTQHGFREVMREEMGKQLNSSYYNLLYARS